MGVVLFIDMNPQLHKFLCTHLRKAEGETNFTQHGALLVISLLLSASREYALNRYFAQVAVELICVLLGIKKKLTNWAKMRGHDDLQGWIKSYCHFIYLSL